MQAGIHTTFKHICAVALVLAAGNAWAEQVSTDLLSDTTQRWHTDDPELWDLREGSIAGRTRIFDGAKTDPQASTFLVSDAVFAGNVSVTIDVSFSVGRYLGVYLDYDQESGSGIWMATGHALAGDAPKNEVERAYIKTVENGFWIVRANGELQIDGDEIVSLRFSRTGDEYQVFHNDRLIAIYRKPGGYPPGRLQLRLTNSAVTIHRLAVQSDRIE